MEDVKYGFLPWVRQGLAAEITQEDQLGTDVDHTRNRATFSLDLNVHATPVTGNTIENDVAQVNKEIPMFGPGEVIGIDPRAIVKTDPLPGITDYEPNYLPYIEFYDEDFPWRYTPARANGDKLRPWIWLLVLEESEFERILLPDAHLPAITNGEENIPFPLAGQTWAWAHVHVNKSLSGSSNKADALFDAVQSEPDIASSRLICPRKLKPNTKYHAFLIPAFEQGRLAGLGLENDIITAVDVQLSSWTDYDGKEFPGVWPYFYEWSFFDGKRC